MNKERRVKPQGTGASIRVDLNDVLDGALITTSVVGVVAGVMAGHEVAVIGSIVTGTSIVVRRIIKDRNNTAG